MRVTTAALTLGLLVCNASAFAHSPDKEPAAIVEVDGAGNWSVKDGGWSFGPAVGLEVTPITRASRGSLALTLLRGTRPGYNNLFLTRASNNPRV